eukprot:scaffold1122_cov45-Isochrysis_galbana.AAC.1
MACGGRRSRVELKVSVSSCEGCRACNLPLAAHLHRHARCEGSTRRISVTRARCEVGRLPELRVVGEELLDQAE